MRRGDPLPDLPIDGGFDMGAYAGGWLLLLFHTASAEGLQASVEGAAAGFGKRIKVALVAASLEAVAARRVGALVDSETFFDLALLIDPRGRVQHSATGRDAEQAARNALSAAAAETPL